MLVVVLAMLVVLLLAVGVLLYVAFPHRHKLPSHLRGRQLADRMARLAARWRPAEEAPVHGVLGSRERDEALGYAFAKAEQLVTHPFAALAGRPPAS